MAAAIADDLALENNENDNGENNDGERDDNAIEMNRRSRSPQRNGNERPRSHSQRIRRSPHRRSGDVVRAISQPARIDYDHLRFEIISGKRLNSKLLHTLDENHLYQHKVTNNSVAQYDCYKLRTLGCTAKLYIENGLCFRKVKSNGHNHDALTAEIAEIKLKNEIKVKCSDAKVLAEHIGANGTGNVRGVFQHCLAK